MAKCENCEKKDRRLELAEALAVAVLEVCDCRYPGGCSDCPLQGPCDALTAYREEVTP